MSSLSVHVNMPVTMMGGLGGGWPLIVRRVKHTPMSCQHYTEWYGINYCECSNHVGLFGHLTLLSPWKSQQSCSYTLYHPVHFTA